jgi:type I restriction enzyme S subunit
MINANGGRGFLSRYIYGDKPGLNLAQVAGIPIPIPPVFERQQILLSLQKYQLICAQWTRQLGNERKLATTLSASAVASITGIAIEPEKEEPLKAPQTEIVALLRPGTLPAVTDQSPLATLLSRQKGSMNAGDLFQRYGGEIDTFYAQLKLEISHGWIAAPPSDPDAEGFASVRVKEQA